MTRTRYKRVCADCGDIKEVGNKPKKGRLCLSCSAKKKEPIVKFRTYAKRKTFIYFCANCSDVRYTDSGSKRKTCYCADCSRKLAKKKKYKIFYDLINMRYVNTKPPAKEKRVYKAKPKVKKVSKPKVKKSVSKEAIEKIREINRQYRESRLETEDKIVEYPFTPPDVERDMINDFLKANEPSVKFSDYKPLYEF